MRKVFFINVTNEKRKKLKKYILSYMKYKKINHN